MLHTRYLVVRARVKVLGGVKRLDALKRATHAFLPCETCLGGRIQRERMRDPTCSPCPCAPMLQRKDPTGAHAGSHMLPVSMRPHVAAQGSNGSACGIPHAPRVHVPPAPPLPMLPPKYPSAPSGEYSPPTPSSSSRPSSPRLSSAISSSPKGEAGSDSGWAARHSTPSSSSGNPPIFHATRRSIPAQLSWGVGG